jgi:hypothetical protein
LEQIIIRQGALLNWATILADLQPLCELKESPEIVDRLIALRDGLSNE